MEIDRDLIVQRVASLVLPIIDESGFELVDLELVGRQGSYVLRIFIEKPGGVSINDCVEINRELSCLLDLEDPIPSRYTLEVSSPGLDRPFKTTRDYQRALGKRVKVLFVGENGGTVSLIGMLEGIKNGTVEITSGEEKHCIPFECIKKAHRELDQDWDKG